MSKEKMKLEKTRMSDKEIDEQTLTWGSRGLKAHLGEGVGCQLKINNSQALLPA